MELARIRLRERGRAEAIRIREEGMGGQGLQGHVFC